jgi:succinoglycan biosynthesis protein ExoM
MSDHLVVCVLTYLRPDLLRSCLSSFERLRFVRSAQPAITVLVVDNDPDGSGHAFCQRARPGYRWDLVSHVENQRGISFARNTAIRLARALGNLVAFVDDDETVDEAWADELLHCYATCHAEVVTGPVLSVFAAPQRPAWVDGCEVYVRRRYPTGTVLGEAITGNVLMGPAILERYPDPFDTRFALTGGEDTHFFRSIALAGHRIVYCNDAIIFETVPKERVSLAYVLARTFRTTIGYNRSVWLLRPSPGFFCERVAKSLFRLALGLGLLLATGAFSASGRVRGLVNITKAAGTWAAFLNVRPKAYGKPAATNAPDRHEGLSGTRS